MFEKNLLANKRILVTGGGSGLGAAMARAGPHAFARRYG
jgi:NAD(P)-dependent dehydrogenase (short-subunit alcohol dehydrogenase family)